MIATTLREEWKTIVVVLVGFALAIQLVPYGREHPNPPVVNEPEWSNAETRALFLRACGDCHSNETDWPWYSAIAPASWLVRWDVEEARSHFNVSEWGREHNHGEDAAELVRDGEMPLWRYRLLHPEARLSEAERERLVTGLEATFSGWRSSAESGDGREGHHDGDPGGDHEH